MRCTRCLVETLEENRVRALVYPVLRRKPARIGDEQAGTTCQVSAHSGLPALSVPAAWTDDGLPIGMELLGPAWSDAELMSLGYAIEQTLKLRRPPFSTPPLINGKAPASRSVEIGDEVKAPFLFRFDWDAVTSRLRYQARVAAERVPHVIAMWLHRGTPDKPGPAVHQLFEGTAGSAGTVTLSYGERGDLENGGLFLRIYWDDQPQATVIPLRLAPR